MRSRAKRVKADDLLKVESRIAQVDSFFTSATDDSQYIQACNKYWNILSEIRQQQAAQLDPVLALRQAAYCEYSMVVCQIRVTGIPLATIRRKLEALMKQLVELKMDFYCQKIDDIACKFKNKKIYESYVEKHALFILQQVKSPDPLVFKHFFGIADPSIQDLIDQLKNAVRELGDNTDALLTKVKIYKEIAELYRQPPDDEDDLEQADKYYAEAINTQRMIGLPPKKRSLPSAILDAAKNVEKKPTLAKSTMFAKSETAPDTAQDKPGPQPPL